MDEILQLKLSVCKYRPLSGGKGCPKLPKVLLGKHATTSINCPDTDECFIYSVLGAIYPQNCNPQRYTKYRKHVKKLKADDLTYPVSIKQIPKFEKRNKLSINCFGYEKVIYPLYVSKEKCVKEIDLLLYRGHYYLIRNLSRLLSNTNCKPWKARFICRSCLSWYYTKSKLNEHKQFCDNDGQRYSLPPPNSYKSFQNYRGQILNDFVIFFDIESAIIDVPSEQNAKSKLKKIGRHQPIAIGAKRVSLIPSYDGDLVMFTGVDCVKKFFDYLQHQAVEIQTIKWVEYKNIDWTSETLNDFNSRTHCEFCGVEFSGGIKKTADHHHLKEKNNYRQALCNR